MLSFEKVLSFFESYLSESSDVEILQTSKGYLGIDWCGSDDDEYYTKRLYSPEIMRDFLIECKVGYAMTALEAQLHRDLSKQEEAIFEEKKKALENLCV